MSAQSTIDRLNQIVRDMGVTGGRGRSHHSMNLWTPPRGWKGTVYLFGYTPWITVDPETGQKGFFALKYRQFKNGKSKLIKSIRFGKRKVAKARATQWYNKHYRKGANQQ